MAIVLEGVNTSIGTGFVTLSSSTRPRSIFIQARNNIWLRVSGGTQTLVLGDTSGLHVDLGCNAPNTIEVAGLSAGASVSMWSLDPGERR